jgi:hypothetical protein
LEETMSNLNTADGVKAYMSEASSEADWNNRCDAVKAANGGYPSFWFETIIQGGVLANTRARLGW